METKGNSVNGLDKEEGKNDAGATPLKTTLIGQASGPGPYNRCQCIPDPLTATLGAQIQLMS